MQNIWDSELNDSPTEKQDLNWKKENQEIEVLVVLG